MSQILSYANCNPYLSKLHSKMDDLQASSVPLVDKCSSQAVILTTRSPNKVADSTVSTVPNSVLYMAGRNMQSSLSPGSANPVASSPSPRQGPVPLLNQLKLTDDLKKTNHG